MAAHLHPGTATRRVGRMVGIGRTAQVAALAVAAILLAACAGGTDIEPAAPGPGAGAGATGEVAGGPIGDVDAGRRLATERNCVSCHTADGTSGVGPTWRGLHGSTEQLVDGTTVRVDRAYLVRSIREPGAQVVAGFEVVEMPTVELSAREVDDLVAYIESLAGSR